MWSVAIVRRPQIWGWEFGNECNLLAHLPNASEHRPQIVPALGTPELRTAKDELKFSQLRVAYQNLPARHAGSTRSG